MSGNEVGTAQAALPRLYQESRETLQRLRLGGPFYILLWLLAGAACDLWQRARWPYLLVAGLFAAMTVMRFRIKPLPPDAGETAMRNRLDYIWGLLIANAALWGVAVFWLLVSTPDESARTVAAVSSYAFATAFAHNFPMRLRHAFVAVFLLYLSTLVALVVNGSRFELVAVSFLYLVYVSLALRRSHAEYLQRLGLEDELRRQRDLFEQQSRRDGLTGLANRRRFTGAFEHWFAAARTSGAPLALTILDLDHFKAVNDGYGHAAGDASLRAFADALQRNFDAPGDTVARLGGEEFAVLARGEGHAAALERAERFRAGLAHMAWEGLDGARLTVSIGVAALDAARHAEPDDLYREADAALYRAKAAGRDRVEPLPADARNADGRHAAPVDAFPAGAAGAQ